MGLKAAIHRRTSLLLAAVLLASTAAAPGGEINVGVRDRDGHPVPEVAVYARLLDSPAGEQAVRNVDSSGSRTAEMNQKDLAFHPHLLIVKTGTRIDFPNNDDVRHHVYSFSPARRFDFSISAGSVERALTFDVPGIVTLGCNIHDDMLAYILVVDTPFFAKTQADGSARVYVPVPGRYEITIWTPRAGSRHLPEPVVLEFGDSGALDYQYQFAAKLYPPHDHSDTSLIWSDY